MYIIDMIVEILRLARLIWMCFIFEQITHVTIFIKLLFNCTTFHPLGLLQVHTTKTVDEKLYMRYLPKDKTHPSQITYIIIGKDTHGMDPLRGMLRERTRCFMKGSNSCVSFLEVMQTIVS